MSFTTCDKPSKALGHLLNGKTIRIVNDVRKVFILNFVCDIRKVAVYGLKGLLYTAVRLFKKQRVFKII